MVPKVGLNRLNRTRGQRRSIRAWRRLADQPLKREVPLSVESRRQARIETGPRTRLAAVSIRLEEPAFSAPLCVLCVLCGQPGGLDTAGGTSLLDLRGFNTALFPVAGLLTKWAKEGILRAPFVQNGTWRLRQLLEISRLRIFP